MPTVDICHPSNSNEPYTAALSLEGKGGQDSCSTANMTDNSDCDDPSSGDDEVRVMLPPLYFSIEVLLYTLLLRAHLCVSFLDSAAIMTNHSDRDDCRFRRSNWL